MFFIFRLHVRAAPEALAEIRVTLQHEGHYECIKTELDCNNSIADYHFTNPRVTHRRSCSLIEISLEMGYVQQKQRPKIKQNKKIVNGQKRGANECRFT